MSEVLDEVEYEAFTDLESEKASFVLLRQVPDIDRKKARFFSENCAENPDLHPLFDITEQRARAWGYLALKDSIESSDAPQNVKEAYIPAIEGSLKSISILLASANNDLEGFIEANVEEYDEPEKAVFICLCEHLRNTAIKYLHESQNIYITEAAKQVLDLLPDLGEGADGVWPSQTEFRKLKKMYSDFFDDMYQGVDIPEEVSGKEMVDIVEKVLANLGYDYIVEEQEPGVNTMAVNHKYKKVKVPYKEVYDRSRLRGLLGHEIRVHVEERIKGEAQPLKLLGRGLRGSSEAGEGKGVNVEMVAYDSAEEFLQTRRFFDIARRHISIGLARGIDGNGQRDFKEVFEIINSIDRLWELTHNSSTGNVNAAIIRALDRTWELLTKRTLKGLVGKGAAHHKDKVYAECRLQQGILLLRNPLIFPYLDLGHYNLAQENHVTILKSINVLPRDMKIKLPK